MIDPMRRGTRATGSALKRLAAVALCAGLCVTPAQTAMAQEQPVPQAPAATSAPQAQTPAKTQAQAQATLSPAPATDENVESAAGPVETGTEKPAPGAENARDASLPHDLSPWGMFMAADRVVKAVMIGLAFASLVTWTVWLAKSLELAGSRARLRSALRAILGSASLEEASRKLGKRGDAGARLVQAAVEEANMSAAALDHADPSGLRERVWSRMSRIQIQTGRRLSRGTGVLATIGSTSPFVGLFGTVWGIMNAFIGISESQTTNLAVVAPGIAEALLATALGLVAAIPAVVIYNVFSRSITGYRQALADAAAGVERLVSRDLDFRKVPAAARERLAAG